MNLEVTKKGPLCVEFRHTGVPGERQTYLLLSDLHLDNPKVDRKQLARLLDEHKERGSKFLLNGDTVCIMQGRNDKRGGKGDLLPEHRVVNYFDAVATTTAEFLSRWSDNIVWVADGNHETAVIKHSEVDVLGLMVHRLNADHGASVIRMGYHSFLKFVFQDEGGGRVRSVTMYAHHGKYGGEVTMGVLGVNRHGSIIPDAGIIWTGHTHDHWFVTKPRLRLRANGEVVNENVYHVKTGTAKDEFNVPGGFGVERLNKPANLAFWAMTLYVEGARGHELKIKWEPEYL